MIKHLPVAVSNARTRNAPVNETNSRARCKIPKDPSRTDIKWGRKEKKVQSCPFPDRTRSDSIGRRNRFVVVVVVVVVVVAFR